MAFRVNDPWVLLWQFLALLWKHLNSFYLNNEHQNQRDKVSIFVSSLLWCKLYNTVRTPGALVWFSVTPSSPLFCRRERAHFHQFHFLIFFLQCQTFTYASMGLDYLDKCNPSLIRFWWWKTVNEDLFCSAGLRKTGWMRSLFKPVRVKQSQLISVYYVLR